MGSYTWGYRRGQPGRKGLLGDHNGIWFIVWWNLSQKTEFKSSAASVFRKVLGENQIPTARGKVEAEERGP